MTINTLAEVTSAIGQKQDILNLVRFKNACSVSTLIRCGTSQTVTSSK